MRSLLDHDSDRGESADQRGAFVRNVVYAVIVIGVIAWFCGFPIH